MRTDRPVALISGGSRGIGRAVVSRLAQDGFDVSFCYRSDHSAADTAEQEARQHGARVFTRQVDVADHREVQAFVADTEAELGPVSAVVAVAGVVRDNPLVLMTDDEWNAVLRTNLDGTFYLCRSAVFAMMKRRQGVVVTMSSVSGVFGNASQTNYAASKAGIIGFTKALAKEVGRYGIRANVAAPGFIETDMTARLSEKVAKEMVERISLGRFGTAAEVGDLVSFLVSERSSYITGQVFQVDGGMSL